MTSDDNSDRGRRTSRELRPVDTFQSHQGTIDIGNRRKVAKMLTTITDYLGTAGHGQFDDSGFRRGRASDWPEIPGEVYRNRHLSRTKKKYNPDRDADGNLTPASPERLSRTASFQGSVSGVQMSPPPLRPSSAGRPGTPSARRRSSELQDPASPSFAGPAGSKRPRRDTLEVPTKAHIPSRSVQERPEASRVASDEN